MNRPHLARIRSKPLRRLTRDAVQEGFSLGATRSNHLALVCPRCKIRTTFSPSLSEGDRRAHHNLRARLRSHGLGTGNGSPTSCPPAAGQQPGPSAP
ncbi:hypothetical protein ACFVIM_23620 [Streptomyces sp. NPDC057638]|uniref:hypothetical protein n=1 Tax=Streptomyces sp. NPDC057638 TaxID=3346190 RepID=UPI0036B84D4B